jgi:aryl-alcohol dehydrogenase-like predicted oxidoreductase
MEYVPLGMTDVQVSRLCLGTMTWGQQNSEAEAHSQMDYALERGINFFDTAEMYPVPPMAETQGRTEEYIGTWFQARGKRDRVVLATKIAGPGAFVAHIRGGSNFSAEQINTAIDTSLKRLRTDYIDLYQLHWPERVTNFFGTRGYTHVPEKDGVPIRETLLALAKAIQAGKIRHIGLSNETPWGLMQFLRFAAAEGLPRVVSIQNPYNLLNRTFEVGLAEMAIREKVGLLAYSPLAFGTLTGKYLNGEKPPGARLTNWTRFGRYTSPRGEQATAAYVQVARDAGLDPAQMALSYVNSRPFLTSNIIGATSMEQLKSNIDSIDLKLEKEVLKKIEAIHVDIANPCP